MNLVSLIDIFTILIFFLLSSAAGVEILPSSKAVKLPQSVSEKSPRETVVVDRQRHRHPRRWTPGGVGGRGARCTR